MLRGSVQIYSGILNASISLTQNEFDQMKRVKGEIIRMLNNLGNKNAQIILVEEINEQLIKVIIERRSIKRKARTEN